MTCPVIVHPACKVPLCKKRKVNLAKSQKLNFVAKNHREGQLLKLIWENPGIQVSGIQVLLPGISLSTINRDLKALVTEGKIVISGSR